MGYYTYRNTKTGEIFTEEMTMKEWDMLLTSPIIEWVPNAGLPTLDSVRLGIRKPDEGFRDVLRTIKKGNPRSKINTF